MPARVMIIAAGLGPSRRAALAMWLGAAALLGGCAHSRPEIATGTDGVDQTCPIELIDLSVDVADAADVPAGGVGAASAASASRSGPPTLADRIAERLTAPATEPRQPRQPRSPGLSAAPPPGDAAVVENLVLSGGGKWGAFGAGFLHQFAQEYGLPDYRIVTGISTGALQSAFVFVGNELVPEAAAGRRYRADTDTLLRADEPQPTGAPGGRTYLDDLPLAYRISRSQTVVDLYISRPSSPTLFDGITILRRGTGSDLNGLRRRLQTLVGDDMLAAIAAAGDNMENERKLYVGLVDMDSGKPFAVDMTALVSGWAAKEDKAKHQIRNCFHDILVASSSEPLVARPVFIRFKSEPGRRFPTGMFMDGGLRHGVFLREVANSRVLARSRRPSAAPLPRTTIIVNGRLESNDKAEPDLASGGVDEKWFKSWSILGLAQRAQAIFTDQVYQLSTERVVADGDRLGDVRLLVARGYHRHSYTPLPGDPRQGPAQSCGRWQFAEKDEGFPPMFMRCLTDYGRELAMAAKGGPCWTRPGPAAGSACPNRGTPKPAPSR